MFETTNRRGSFQLGLLSRERKDVEVEVSTFLTTQVGRKESERDELKWRDGQKFTYFQRQKSLFRTDKGETKEGTLLFKELQLKT